MDSCSLRFDKVGTVDMGIWADLSFDFSNRRFSQARVYLFICIIFPTARYILLDTRHPIGL